MDKKYTVFLSSTYDDLREEITEVIHTLLEINCIPCGMEYFPSDSDKQFEFIKSIIDECDYYILIIAGRYGSIGKDGKSYTEMEYRYALEKGIPILAFIHSDIGSISSDKSEKTDHGKEKLAAFKQSVSTSQLVKYWNGKDDLAKKISTTMVSAIERHPAVGWIRGSALLEELISTYETDPSNLGDILIEIAAQYKKRNNLEKALCLLKWSYFLCPENDNVLREYGRFYFDKQNYTQALKYWEKLLSKQKSCYHYFLCAYAFYHLGNYTKAEEYLNLALKFPDDGHRDKVQNLLIKIQLN